MFALVYKSKANPVFQKQDIQEMLDKARVFNKTHEITGCLIFYDGQFLQYLEGNHIKVLQLFDKIKEDHRHSEVEILNFGEKERREFKDWDMGYEDFFGDNDRIAFLKLAVKEYIAEPKLKVSKDPAIKSFWQNVRSLLKEKYETNPN